MNRPAPVEVSYKSMRFLITHNPTNATLSTFIEVSGARELGRGWVWGCQTKYCASEQHGRRPRRGERRLSRGAPCEGQQPPGPCRVGRPGQGLHTK